MRRQPREYPFSARLGQSVVVLLTLSAAAAAQDAGKLRPTYGMFGTPSLIDMPTAEAAADAELATTVSRLGQTTRTTLTFQITPRLSGSFRYSGIGGLLLPGYNVDDNFVPIDPLPPTVNPNTYYDRSFDLRYQILTETRNRPSVAIGLQDFIGTGVYAGEYVVASKSIGQSLRVTAGLGWGRLASHGSIGTTGVRPGNTVQTGGTPRFEQLFRGDVAPFGGIAWAPTDRVTLKAEYSSDGYLPERRSGITTYRSPWNFGVDVRLRDNVSLSIFALQGDTVGASITLINNLRGAALPGGGEGAPPPVMPRPAGARADLGWTADSAAVPNLRQRIKAALERDGLTYEGLTLSGDTATLRLGNDKFGNEPQALGRAARILTRILPGSVETLRIVPVVKGMALSTVTFRRSDLEQLENSAATDLLARTRIDDAYGLSQSDETGVYPRFSWSLAPYLAFSAFDPNNPLRTDFGLRLQGEYRLHPNIVLSGALEKKLGGNIGSITRKAGGELPAVRTDFPSYAREGDPAIEHLTLTGYARPGRDLYGRVTLGYLENMYAGLSGELLWKPVGSRLALGAEVNFVQQRAFDQLFGLRDYKTVTGHVSAYYSFPDGFHGQLDVGRYLAGDYGATLSLDREFANGWRIGAYATLTDVPFATFGEGSFDKGIRITIPLQAAIGTPSRRASTFTISPLTRDGGARLDVQDRLYPLVRDYHRPELENQWGRVWR